MLSRIGNLLAFQIGWFACVLGSAHGRPWLGPVVVLFLLVLHLCHAVNRWKALCLVLMVGTVGTVIDSTLGYVGVLQFRDSPIAGWLCPPWLIALWLIVLTTLQQSLSWLAERPWIAALLGGVFGPISYYGSVALGALMFGSHGLLNVAILSLLWAALLPLLIQPCRWPKCDVLCARTRVE